MITWRFTGYAGKDIWLSLLPERWQARMIARRLLKSLYPGAAPYTICVQMPTGSYIIVDQAGHIEPIKGDPTGGALWR